MKIAVLASREHARFLVPALKALKELGVPAYALSIAESWIELERVKVDALLAEGSHLILVADSRSVQASWFGFAAGYGATLRNGLSLLRIDPNWAPPPYLKGFPIFEDLEELKAFFKHQRTEWEAEDARQAARAELLELGISFHADALAASIEHGDMHGVNLFLDAGFNPDSRDKHGVPLLCLAARHKHRGVADVLLERGARIDLQSEDRGYSALMDATAAGASELVDFLLGKGANPDLISKDGQTALVIAVGRKDVETSRHLVEHGANPDIKDKLGMSARSYARLFKLPELSALFDEPPPTPPPEEPGRSG